MKKESYFTPESIGGKAREMLNDVEELRKRHPLKLSCDKSALLVLDMQRYFLEESSHAFVPSAQAIIPNISKLIDACSEKQIPIIFTRHLNSETNSGMMAKWWQELITPENPLSEIVDELDTSKGAIIKKSQYDAFHETNLEEMLHNKGITQVIICGVTTHLCCETTARSAFVRGFEVFLTIDGTATFRESFHRATMLSAAHGFAMPMLTSEIILECGS